MKKIILMSIGVVVSCAVFAAGPATPSEGCGAGSPKSGKPAHAYFEELAARADCLAAFSLRDPDQLVKYKQTGKRPQYVTYEPANDKDPRKQDAAKLVVPAGKVSLPNQVRLPIGTSDGTTTIVTWDAWFGSEFRHEFTNIGNYKTFQFASPKDRIWFEVRTRFKLDQGRQQKKARRGAAKGENGEAPPAKAAGAEKPAAAVKAAPAPKAGGNHDLVGMVDARGYGAGGTTLGPNVKRGAPLSPQAGNFEVRAETWTRYWVEIDQRANDWDLMSLWVADENHDPVKIIDRLQFNVKGSVEAFWLEYNTSSKGNGANLAERVGYVRNVAMLRNVKDVESLLKRPVK